MRSSFFFWKSAFLFAHLRERICGGAPRELYFPFSPGEPRQSASLACDAMVTSFPRTPFRSACNSLSAHFRLERRCRIPPQQYRLRDAARRSFSCRRFMRRHRDFSNGRCHPAAHLRSGQQSTPPKIEEAAHTVRQAPTPGPLTLALTFPTHSDDRIKKSPACVYSSFTYLRKR